MIEITVPYSYNDRICSGCGVLVTEDLCSCIKQAVSEAVKETIDDLTNEKPFEEYMHEESRIK